MMMCTVEMNLPTTGVGGIALTPSLLQFRPIRKHIEKYLYNPISGFQKVHKFYRQVKFL